MSQETRPYVVRQGDYLAKLAWRFGFDADEVWGHPKNAELRQLRGNHDILAPGDVIHLPVPKQAGLPLKKGQVNRYVAKVPKRTVELKLHNAEGPIAGESYFIEGLGRRIEGKSDEEGKVSLRIPITVREVRLILENYGPFDLGVGDLDPLSEITGVQTRLAALGHYWGDATGEVDDDTRDAIMRFQRATGIAMSGELTPETLKALEEAYGW